MSLRQDPSSCTAKNPRNISDFPFCLGGWSTGRSLYISMVFSALVIKSPTFSQRYYKWPFTLKVRHYGLVIYGVVSRL